MRNFTGSSTYRIGISHRSGNLPKRRRKSGRWKKLHSSSSLVTLSYRKRQSQQRWSGFSRPRTTNDERRTIYDDDNETKNISVYLIQLCIRPMCCYINTAKHDFDDSIITSNAIAVTILSAAISLTTSPSLQPQQ